MQKSFLLVLGAFVVVAFMFVVNEDNVKNDEVVTTFEVRDSGIKVSNSLTGENFIIANDEIVDVSVVGLANIEPAAGDEHHDEEMTKEDKKYNNAVHEDAVEDSSELHEDTNEDGEEDRSKDKSENDTHHEEKEDEKH